MPQGLEACLVGSVLGPARSLVWPLRASPTVLGPPGPPRLVISIQVTEGHRPPRKGRGRGASGIWLPSHRKDNSRTWIVQDGEFPDTATHDSTRLTFWPHLASPPNSNQTQEQQGFEGKKKVTKGHEDINYGLSKSDVVE